MKIRELLLAFFVGVVIGVGISPLTNKTPQQALLSPLTSSVADDSVVSSPCPCSAQEKVLGANEEEKEIIKTPKPATSYFGQLINSSPVPVSPTPVKELKNIETFSTSSYQGKITCAIFGDSMVDVMGTELTSFKSSLKKYYPQATIKLYNFGIGAQNVEQAFERVEQEYNYQDRRYSSLIDLNPDIVVLGSFSYNPFSEPEDELYRHWASLVKIIDKIKNNTKAKIIILAEIAPNKEKFGQGPKGVNWDQDFAWQHATKIQSYLENAVNFAKTHELEIADAYHKTLKQNNEGSLSYINPDDHIHQNEAGNLLMAQLLAEKIYKLNLFK